MQYHDSMQQIAAYREQIAGLRRKMREVQVAVEPEPVTDYVFATPAGPRSLSSLFGNKRDLFVIHNMGTSCAYCTLWADGFNGLYQHIADRAAFAVASPDPPDVQQGFAAGRGWRFPMVSHQGTEFVADMGYRSETGGCLPGVSAFQRDGARILRVADTGLHPGDDFCTLWHMLDLLPEAAAGWGPKFGYG
ncbi:MAG: DUF899 family protein [Acetobacteraceae bacterium]|jgi:predicted dithiol-disulfide oxidoreductase (DUF899 family)